MTNDCFKMANFCVYCCMGKNNDVTVSSILIVSVNTFPQLDLG